MLSSIKNKNEAFKELKLRLKNNPRQSLIELDNILSTTKDKKAFVFLMDSYETEKEITREIIESMLENTIAINIDIIDMFEQNSNNFSKIIVKVFAIENLKSLLIAAIVIGLTISISTNENIAIKVIDYFAPTLLESEKGKDKPIKSEKIVKQDHIRDK
jgi:hypothetical protein